MADNQTPLSADSLRDNRIAEPSWIGIVAKIGLAYTGEVSDEASNELIEDAKEDFEALIAAALQSERQRIADSLPKLKERPVSGPQRNGTAQAVRRAHNQAIEAVRALLELPGASASEEER